MKVDGDIIIAYAAKPGDIALDECAVTGAEVLSGNGPYAQSVAKFLPQGLKHTDFFQQVRKEVTRLTSGRQRTWENGGFLEEFYFSTSSISAPVAPEDSNSKKSRKTSPQRQFMLVKVDDKQRQLPLIAAEELSKLRMSNSELKTVNRAFRLDLTSKDIGKHIQGIAFVARNDFGVNAVFYDGSEGSIHRGITLNESNWRQSGVIEEMLTYPTGYEIGRRRFLGGKNGYPLLPGDLVVWTMMKEDA